MIRSLRGLAIATLVAGVLGVIVLFGGGERTAPSRALVPGFDTDKLVRLAWSRGDGPEIVIERAGTTWRWTRPLADIPAAPAAIDAVSAALRGGRWHRRAELSRAGSLRVALTATAGGRTVKIGLGDGIPGAGQSWIVVGEHAYLVDDWIARALGPAPLALRETRPLQDIASAQTIVVDRVVPYVFAIRIQGTPRKLVRPIVLYLAPPIVDELTRALAALTIVDLPTKAGVVTTTFTIDAPNLVTVEQRDDAGCPDSTIAISGTLGPGCVPRDQLAAVDHAIELLRRPSTVLADARMLPFDPVSLTLPDGATVELDKRPRIADRDADPTRVAELLAVLGNAYSVVEATPAKPIATLTAKSRANTTLTLELLANKRVRRQGEPVELVLGAGAWDVLARPASALSDPTPWSEEPTTIRTITIGKTTYVRGAVVGEWSPAKVGIEDLARMLAQPRVTAASRAPAKILHTIALEIVAPGSAPVTHTLALGERCVAVAENHPLVLDPALCAAIVRMAAP